MPTSASMLYRFTPWLLMVTHRLAAATARRQAQAAAGAGQAKRKPNVACTIESAAASGVIPEALRPGLRRGHEVFFECWNPAKQPGSIASFCLSGMLTATR